MTAPVRMDIPMGKRTQEIKLRVCEDDFAVICAQAALRRQKPAEFLFDVMRRALYGVAHELILLDRSGITRPAVGPEEGEE